MPAGLGRKHHGSHAVTATCPVIYSVDVAEVRALLKAVNLSMSYDGDALFRGVPFTLSGELKPHDRAFLGHVVGAVIELDGIHGEPRFHAGNYTAYRIEKEHRWQRLLLGFEAPEKARTRLVADIEWTRAQAGPVERTVRRGLGACGTPGRWPARPGRARDGYAGRCCPPGGWPHRRPSRYWHWRSRRR